MKVFKEIVIGKFVLRFYPSDNGWMCGITNEMMSVLEESNQESISASDDFELVPVDPTPEMKSAAVEVELFDSDTGEGYVLSWEEAEQIYFAMLNASPSLKEKNT